MSDFPIVRPAIVKAHTGESPGPASSFTYTVEIGYDVNTITAPGVVPHNSRLPDAIDVYAVPNGTAIICHEFEGGNMQFYFWEFPAWDVCDG